MSGLLIGTFAGCQSNTSAVPSTANGQFKSRAGDIVAVYGDSERQLAASISAARHLGLTPAFVTLRGMQRDYKFPVYAQVLRSQKSLIVRAYGRVYAYPLTAIKIYFHTNVTALIGPDGLPPVRAPRYDRLVSVHHEAGKFLAGNTRRKESICPDCIALLVSVRAIRKLAMRWNAKQDPWQIAPIYVAWQPPARSGLQMVGPNTSSYYQCPQIHGGGVKPNFLQRCYPSGPSLPSQFPSCSDCGSGGSGNQLCKVKSITGAQTPPDRGRTTIGVGENVELQGTGTNWSVSGDGKLSSGNILTAFGKAGNITAINSGGCEGTGIDFIVITPTNAVYLNIGTPTEHHKGEADIGMYTQTYLEPDTVSFRNAMFQEKDADFVASGGWLCWNGHPHQKKYYPQKVGDDVFGTGSLVLAFDSDYQANCTGNQFQQSSASVKIPYQYTLQSGGNWSDFGTSVTQNANETAAGNMTISKSEASRQTTVNSPNSTW
jgi:hypothetical protein